MQRGDERYATCCTARMAEVFRSFSPVTCAPELVIQILLAFSASLAAAIAIASDRRGVSLLSGSEGSSWFHSTRSECAGSLPGSAGMILCIVRALPCPGETP